MPLLGKPKVLHWTWHARDKMRFYKLSETRVRRILYAPKRIEEGIAPHTVAAMQPAGSKRHPCELWVMVVEAPTPRKGRGSDRGVGNTKIMKIISAWRYPGVTKPRSEVARSFFEKEYQDYISRRIN